MTLILSEKNYDELFLEESQQINKYKLGLEPFEDFYQTPKQLGKGYSREIEVYPELWLTVYDEEYYHDVLTKIPINSHPLQFGILVLGMFSDTHGQVNRENMFISGGGVQRKIEVFNRKSQRMVGIDITMSPQLLKIFFPGSDGEIAPELSFLAKENDWQTLIYPKTTPAIQGVVQQIIDCPYQGIAKRMYLQTFLD
jgi:hypothetical protein